ncbi:cytochrome P450 89A2-like [Typha latifolia]|uniref:cytochrome P450 89A2-like n=1 Tax=Typha latifolia TaxID=4733 RepID=UPI003C2AE260
MVIWLLVVVVVVSVFLATTILLLFHAKGGKPPLPPGPPFIPLLGNLLLLRHSVNLQNIEPVLRSLRARYGPVITLRVGSRPFIFVADRALAHRALVSHGAIFSDRPVAVATARLFSADGHIISTAPYAPLWRLLRRNLIAEILHPSYVKVFSSGRRWVVGILADRLRAHPDDPVMESFQFAMFYLLVLMCFGEKLDEEVIKEIEISQHEFLLYGSEITVLSILPRISRFVFRNRIKRAMELRRRRKEVLLPLIRARREFKKRKSEQKNDEEKERFLHSYVDSLLEIRIPEEGGRSLTEDEMVALCTEFLNAATDATTTTLQWIMANLVKNQDIQRRVAEEIESVVGEREMEEEDMEKMKFLNAVILEGLRRHPPGHFVLPHAVMEEAEIGGYRVPKGSVVNFMVADMALDEEVWKEPMEFKPERFLEGGEGDGVDVTGSREIKMMPFGAGRRICPGLELAMLHLHFFVANLVREFEWLPVEGKEVDLAEKQEFTWVMKNPLMAHVVPRTKA